MPHCIIEYAKVLEPKINDLIGAVHGGAVTSALFAEKDIKTRAISYEHFQTGISDALFVHVTVHMLSGRAVKQKQKLSKCILNGIIQLNIENCSLTVEIIDIDRHSYAKIEVLIKQSPA